MFFRRGLGVAFLAISSYAWLFELHGHFIAVRFLCAMFFLLFFATIKRPIMPLTMLVAALAFLPFVVGEVSPQANLQRFPFAVIILCFLTAIYAPTLKNRGIHTEWPNAYFVWSIGPEYMLVFLATGYWEYLRNFVAAH